MGTARPVRARRYAPRAPSPAWQPCSKNRGTMILQGGYVRDVLGKAPGTKATVHGWVKTRRDSKGVHFLQGNGGSTFTDLQVVIDAGSIPDETLRDVTTGACVRVSGELTVSPAKG